MLKIKDLFKSTKQKKFELFKKALIKKEDIEFNIYDKSCSKVFLFIQNNVELFKNIVTFESDFDRLPISVRINANSITGDISYFEEKYCVIKFSQILKKNYKKLLEKID